ncbi:hypothetical protein B296_00009395 [Ensete ventricosum]|uniref:Uncharacterized protein n=1 Tax=Ensete ventricosum TaxID=4639 RepID=A0A427A1F7_ENSVE|nr:hypothetical protein B296_00009395 [Ensete ventricosum]
MIRSDSQVRGQSVGYFRVSEAGGGDRDGREEEKGFSFEGRERERGAVKGRLIASRNETHFRTFEKEKTGPRGEREGCSRLVGFA